MAEAQCFEPSSLLVTIHKNVPFLTGGDRDNSADVVLNLDEGTREFYDYFVVSARFQISDYGTDVYTGDKSVQFRAFSCRSVLLRLYEYRSTLYVCYRRGEESGA